MAVNWGLAGNGFNAQEALQSFGQAQQMGRQQEQYAQQQQALQQRRAIGGQAAGGDFGGARQAAASAGDFDILRAIDGMEAQHYDRLNKEFDVIGQLHPQLKTLSVEARASVAAPILTQAGFSPEELANVDWTDQGIDAVYSMSQAGKAALASRMKSMEPYTLSPGSRRYAGTEVIADNPAVEKPIWDSEGGQLIYPSAYARGGGQPQQATPLGNSQPSAGNVSFTGLPGERVTSTFRTPAHNKEVGGVGNSYHTRRDASGNPMARDSVPPAGMSMASYASALRQQNPGLDVINEGDHVHMEPRTGGQRAAQTNQGVVQVRPPRQRASSEQRAPSGYRFNGDRLEPIPGGPADKAGGGAGGTQNNRKAEADFRKEFENRKEVKDFRSARTQFNALRDTALSPNATAQDDIAVIFQFMKTLDPTSTVREGEFATAQNAGGIPDTIRNAFNKAQNGERLNPAQRRNMAKTAYRSYQSFRNAYNETAGQFRSYATDNGINPDRVARSYTPDKAPRGAPPRRLAQFKIVKVE